MKQFYALDAESHATIIAALRYYQQQGMGDPFNRSDDIHELATNGDEVQSLDEGDIDNLVVELNTGAILPVAVVEIEGGLMGCVRTSVPMQIVVLDSDTGGCDSDAVKQINDEDVYIHKFRCDKPAEPGQSGVNPEHVEGVLAQIDAA